jgi:hypothetical protein
MTAINIGIAFWSGGSKISQSVNSAVRSEYSPSISFRSGICEAGSGRSVRLAD